MAGLLRRAAGALLQLRPIVLVPSFGVGAYTMTAEEPRRFIYTSAVIPLRLARDIYAATTILAGIRGLELRLGLNE